ncbi:MAG: 1-acyl-sn-glycerol-3-phosphate acyltransferase [Deltaproteobacteria bacterium]|nr:1-acyl-sn-glycerol-3-phosphate acyltransferase [Deltaproteobacteria bacterium]
MSMLRNRLILLSILFWTYLAITSVLLSVLGWVLFLLTAPFDRRRRVMHLFTSLWAFHYVWLMPIWRVSIEGRERIPNHISYVMVSNHQSLLDILVLFGLFKNFKWVSKSEIFRIPFVGWNMLLCDYVSLSRGRKAGMLRMMRDCRRHIERGSSVLIFPEGTRSEDGELRRFRDGAFILARSTGVDIIPIAIDGTSDALPKHGLLFKRSSAQKIRVKVLEPIRSDVADIERLTQNVHAMIKTEVAAFRSKDAS